MDVTKIGNSSHDRKAAVDELIRGRELTAQLGAILEEVSPTSRDLIKEISGSFSRALIALDYGVETDLNFSEESQKIQSEKRSGNFSKKCNSLTRTIVSPTLNDGHFWRKYGQKTILNSEFPRSYYRCICKHDEKCLARRQVQPSKDNPSLFTIKYVGEHTCQDMDSPERMCVIDFESSSATCSGTFTPGSSSSDYVATQEMGTLDESESAQLVEEYLMEAPENGDAMPCLQTRSNHDLFSNFMEGSLHEFGYLFGV